MDAVRQKQQAGVALIVVVLILALLLGLAAALTSTMNMDTGLRAAFDNSTLGFYAAESGLNRGINNYRDIFLNFQTPQASDFLANTITVGNRSVTYQLTDNTVYDASGNPPLVTIPPGQVFGGLSSSEYDYIASSTASPISSGTSDVQSRVNAEYKVGNIPIFQFVAFYARDMEIAPGANMNLHGPVHSNANLYLDADGQTLLIGDNPPNINTVSVTAQKDIYRGRKRQNLCETGTVTVDALQDLNHDGRLDPMNLLCNGTTTRKVPASELAAWKGSMVSNMSSISVPLPSDTAKGTGKYWTSANLRIVLNLTTTWQPTTPLVGPPSPYQFVIEAQNNDATGSQDSTNTTLLRKFMADTTFNTNSSSIAGTRPIFYTDVPVSTTCGCANTTPTTCTNMVATCYNPPFQAAPDASPTPASIRVTDANNRVYGTGRTMTTSTLHPNVYPSPSPTPSNSNDADYRRGGFYNQREQKWMYLLNVNLHDLLAWNAAQPSTSRFFDPATTTNGGVVIYLSVQGPNSGVVNNYGVRIFGSTTLPFPAGMGTTTGVTVVSDQAVYVAGNYNTPATVAAGWQPSAIIGDSVNILSQNYFQSAPAAGILTNDAQSNQSLTDASRNAADTTVRAAFIGGVDDTIPGTDASGYNGGLENYPRLHEDWSNNTLTYAGSFVSLGLPLYVNGDWCGTSTPCNIYNPPSRVWDFDSQFNNPIYLPPMTPKFVYVQQILFTENFK